MASVLCEGCGYGREREKILLSYPQLGLRAVRRIPGLATFWYALSRLKGGEVERALQELALEEKDMAIDGKRLRGSKRVGEAEALQVISLAGVALRQVWEQKAVEGGDELATAIALLEEFSLVNKVISADICMNALAGLAHNGAVRFNASVGARAEKERQKPVCMCGLLELPSPGL